MAQSAGIDKMSTKHEAIMRYLVANPTCTMRECAQSFGVTQSWLSCIIHSDVFQAKMHDLHLKFDDTAMMSLNDKVAGIANMAADKLLEQLDDLDDPKFLRDTMNDTLKALGYGSQKSGTNIFMPGSVQENNTVSADVLHAAQARRAQQNYKDVADTQSPETLEHKK